MNLSEYQALGNKIEKMGQFVGCNITEFALTSQVPLQIAKMNGLTPKSKVLDIGCGCCRVGHWFIDYLDQNCYYGIEPNKEMLRAGKEVLLPAVLDKSPQFNHGSDFDLSVFDVSYDVIIAFSIWSHACKKQIEKVLSQLSKYHPCTFLGTIIFATKPRQDYKENDWVGFSHKSKVSGTIKHSLKWLDSACKKYGCVLTPPSPVESIGGEQWNNNNNKLWPTTIMTSHQHWIKITTK